MAAKDYEIALGWQSAYFAKKKKKPSNIMSEDRREITEGEIMLLMDWCLNKYLKEKKKEEGGFAFDSLQNEGYSVQLKLLKKDDKNAQVSRVTDKS